MTKGIKRNSDCKDVISNQQDKSVSMHNIDKNIEKKFVTFPWICPNKNKIYNEGSKKLKF